MLSNTPGNKLNKYVEDYVVFDLETTGVSWKTDAVIEISGIRVRGGKAAEEFSTLVDPNMHISHWATEVNGITDEMVAGYPTFDVALEQFLNFAGDDILVGHNIHSFDMKFIQRDAYKYWRKSIGNDYVDTYLLARRCLPELHKYSLVNLSEHFGFSSQGAHRALYDCRMNHKLFEQLGRELNKAEEKGLTVCPRCGSLLVKRSGRFGSFMGCSGYPACRFTRNV